MTNLGVEREKRWSFSVSVGIMLANYSGYGPYDRQLILVRKRDSGLWTPIAGGVKQGETSIDALWRELYEETGLTQALVALEGSQPIILENPQQTRTSTGFVYDATMKTPIDSKGFFHDSEEIELVKPHTLQELAELVNNPQKIFKPEYNLSVISEWQKRCWSRKYAFDNY
jgi:8-oxo-dGTP pyrophosphatase MutT (NUDIX family)